MPHVPKPSPAHVPENRATPNPGTGSNQEIRSTQIGAEAASSTGDEVQVHRDDEGSIVIKYVDRSGNVVLQVPSSQVLGLTRAIEKALNDEAQKHAAARALEARGEGGYSHGR